MAERKVWTEEEDRILKALVQVRKIKKWSQISKIFSTQFGISHRNGKQCRERYLNHLASGLKKGEWTPEEQDKLIKLHNSYGNRWAEISKQFEGRTDNCVKNQLYSKLRKSLRFINDAIQKNMRKRFKLLKINFIYKLIEMADEKYKSIPAIKKEAYEQSYQLKNKILKLQCDEENYDNDKIIALISQINQFNKKYKKRIPKKKIPKGQNDWQDSSQQFNDDLISDQIQQKQEKACEGNMNNVKTEIQIRVLGPEIQEKKMKQTKSGQIENEQIRINQNKVLKKGSSESSNDAKINRLHSLSIEKQSAFQTIFNSMQPEKKMDELSLTNHLFTRVDPTVHGTENQNNLKTKRSSSIESVVPNIMIDLGSSQEVRNELQVSRLRSFGSIEESYQIQNNQHSKPSSFQKQFMNKEEVEYWLSNVQ